ATIDGSSSISNTRSLAIVSKRIHRRGRGGRRGSAEQFLFLRSSAQPLRPPSLGRRRQQDTELRTALGAVTDDHLAPVRLDGVAHEGGPETAASLLAAEPVVDAVEALEDPPAFATRNARAGVGDGERDAPVLSPADQIDDPSLTAVLGGVLQ